MDKPFDPIAKPGKQWEAARAGKQFGAAGSNTGAHCRTDVLLASIHSKVVGLASQANSPLCPLILQAKTNASVEARVQAIKAILGPGAVDTVLGDMCLLTDRHGKLHPHSRVRASPLRSCCGCGGRASTIVFASTSGRRGGQRG